MTSFRLGGPLIGSLLGSAAAAAMMSRATGSIGLLVGLAVAGGIIVLADGITEVKRRRRVIPGLSQLAMPPLEATWSTTALWKEPTFPRESIEDPVWRTLRLLGFSVRVDSESGLTRISDPTVPRWSALVVNQRTKNLDLWGLIGHRLPRGSADYSVVWVIVNSVVDLNIFERPAKQLRQNAILAIEAELLARLAFAVTREVAEASRARQFLVGRYGLLTRDPSTWD